MDSPVHLTRSFPHNDVYGYTRKQQNKVKVDVIYFLLITEFHL